jgi:hypothetical protein
MAWQHWTALVGTLVLAACGGKSGEKTAANAGTPPGDSAGGGMMQMPGMDSGKAMGGMHMNMQRMQMMSMTRAHMDSMMRMRPEQMRATMPQHDAMMSRMMDQMGADMRNMKMAGDAQWNALTDSVKRDLADLPNLQGEAFAARMRDHADRVTRLMAMHERMMK